MASLAKSFLDKEEQAQVTRAVQTAEKITTGEIVVMLASESHCYRSAAMLAAFSLAMLLALGATPLLGSLLWLGANNLWLFLCIFVPLLILLYPLGLYWRGLKKTFLRPSWADSEVKRAALAAFYEEGLHRTANANGILVYISVMEQKVWILADRNINTRLEQSVWDRLVVDLTKGIREGQRCTAICRTVSSIGEILRHHFPYNRDDKDELHNLIIR